MVAAEGDIKGGTVTTTGFSVYGFSERRFADAPRERFLAAKAALFTALSEDALAALSNDTKMLYALLLDRANISKVNGFLETDGTIRLYFTVEQVQKKLRRSRQSAARIFRELEHCGLICRRKQDLGRPVVITLNYPENAKLIQPKEDGENLLI